MYDNGVKTSSVSTIFLLDFRKKSLKIVKSRKSKKDSHHNYQMKKGQTMISKTYGLHRIKLKIEQHKPHLAPEENWCAPEGCVIPFPLVAPIQYHVNVVFAVFHVIVSQWPVLYFITTFFITNCECFKFKLAITDIGHCQSQNDVKTWKERKIK